MNKFATRVDDLVLEANMTILNNQECFVAQWILQNPDESISDWTMCHQPNYWKGSGGMKFWMERKS